MGLVRSRSGKIHWRPISSSPPPAPNPVHTLFRFLCSPLSRRVWGSACPWEAAQEVTTLLATTRKCYTCTLRTQRAKFVCDDRHNDVCTQLTPRRANLSFLPSFSLFSHSGNCEASSLTTTIYANQETNSDLSLHESALHAAYKVY